MTTFIQKFCYCVIKLIFFLQTTLENIQEDVLAALENKNPQVKAETVFFLQGVSQNAPL